MPRLQNFVQRSALILTGISLGAALWKTLSRDNASAAAGPLNESLENLEARLASLETVEDLRTAAEADRDKRSAQTVTAVASVESTLATFATRYDNRLVELENRVGDHDARLKELPTLAQVVSTLEEMLASTMSGLDSKLFDQVRSIDVLQATVAQSDELMGRVLDSIDRLQNHNGESAAA